MDAGLRLLPSRMDTPAARKMLRVIQLQEDPQQRRRQWPTGPARGLWQFERGGGVAGVLSHPTTAKLARDVCAARGVNPDSDSVWKTLEHDDALACAFARLLLWTDAKPMPTRASEGWECYVRVWRPGAYWNGSQAQRDKLRQKWMKNWASADA